MVSVADLVANAAAQFGDAPAVSYYGCRMSYKELENLSRRVAEGLRALGVHSAEHVGIRLRNTPQFMAAFLGCISAGATAVVLSPLLPERRIRDQLLDARVKTLITADDLLGVSDYVDQTIVCRTLKSPCSGTAGVTPTRRRTTRGRVARQFEELIDNDGRPRGLSDQDSFAEVAAIMYTGGTTGEAKGVMLTHGNFLAAAEEWGKQLTDGGSMGNEKLLCALPIFHVFGLTVAFLSSLGCGIEVVLHDRFDPVRVLNDIQRERITIMLGVPSMYSLLLNYPNIHMTDLSSIRYCVSGGAPTSDSLMSAMFEKTGVRLRTAYALTETTSTASHQLARGSPVMPTVGRVASGSIVEVVDIEEGRKVLPPGEVGELCISGQYVMKGYWNRPQETEEAFRGGRFHTGDVGYVRPDNYLVLLDRRKDLILCGGFNVFPRVIENALGEHSSIQEVCVIGVDDPLHGQRPKAFIVLRKGVAAPTAEMLMQFLSERLARFELPICIEVRTELPLTPVGKVSKAALRAEERMKMTLAFP